MSSVSVYFDQLLKSIERKRQLSIKEFTKTDLNKSNDFETVNSWYEEIINMVKLKPPDYYVRCINIIESDSGQVISVQYDYHTTDTLDVIIDEINITIHLYSCYQNTNVRYCNE